MSSVSNLDTVIIESALDFAIFAMDLSGSIIRWNKGAERILGWSRAEALGQLGHLVFTPEDRAAGMPEKEIASSLHIGRSLDERWHLRRDQTRFWASGELMSLRAEDGTAVGFVKIVRDRTERWLREQKQLTLAKLGESLANMVEPSAMATLAAELVRTTINATGACYATVTDTVQIDGQSLGPQGSSTAAHLQAACEQCLTQNEPVHDSSNVGASLSLDDSAVGAVCAVPVIESHRIVAVFALVNQNERRWTVEEKDFICEIAVRSRFAIERRRAEERLRDFAASLEKQVERRLSERNRLWANTRDLMAIVDNRGSIQEINPACLDLLGWPAHELVGRSLLDFADEEGAQRFRQVLGQTERAHCQVDLKGADQRVHRLEWSISHDQGAVYLVGRDVTDQLEIEARLRQSQKMEAIGQLTGGLAHDFNNLLAGIIGSIDLLALRIANNRRDDIERHLLAAKTAAHRAAALSHRLLSFARQQPLDPRPVDMNRLVAGMEELLRRTLHVRIQLELRLDATSPVMSDAHQMENAVLNLVINARDAMPLGGRIIISTEDCGASRPLPRRSADSQEVSVNYACISVADDGAGIPAAVIPKIFEPFFTTKPSGQGTGLGLAMIYGFAKQMGGDVDLETELGVGTTVRLFFPCANRAPPQETPAPPPVYPIGGGERILVVEDDATVCNTIVEMLIELGYSPEGVESSQAAVDLLHSDHSLEALITDCGLPGLTGGELAQLARERWPELPICFVTGYDSNDAEIGALRPNEILLTKPLGIDVLARGIASILGRQV